jgi:hypothetical protein
LHHRVTVLILEPDWDSFLLSVVISEPEWDSFLVPEVISEPEWDSFLVPVMISEPGWDLFDLSVKLRARSRESMHQRMCSRPVRLHKSYVALVPTNPCVDGLT